MWSHPSSVTVSFLISLLTGSRSSIVPYLQNLLNSVFSVHKSLSVLRINQHVVHYEHSSLQSGVTKAYINSSKKQSNWLFLCHLFSRTQNKSICANQTESQHRHRKQKRGLELLCSGLNVHRFALLSY